MATDLARNWWLLALRGIAGILFGIAAFVWPESTLATLVLVFGAYVFVDGIFAVVAGIGIRRQLSLCWLVVLEGVAGIILGVLTFRSPDITALILLSLSAHTYRDAFLRAVPATYQPEIAMLLARIGRMWNAFFRGQLTLMLLIGVVSWLGLAALGVPGALSLGIIAGLLELIPNLGPVIATIPAVIVALLQGSTYLPISPLALAVLVILFYSAGATAGK